MLCSFRRLRSIVGPFDVGRYPMISASAQVERTPPSSRVCRRELGSHISFPPLRCLTCFLASSIQIHSSLDLLGSIQPLCRPAGLLPFQGHVLCLPAPNHPPLWRSSSLLDPELEMLLHRDLTYEIRLLWLFLIHICPRPRCHLLLLCLYKLDPALTAGPSSSSPCSP